MKRNDITGLHEMDLTELQQKLETVTQELTKARMEARVGKLANYRLLRNLKKDIARIKTVQTQKKLTKETNKEAKK